MKIVNYESVLTLNNGIQELLYQINKVKILREILLNVVLQVWNNSYYGKFLIKNK